MNRENRCCLSDAVAGEMKLCRDGRVPVGLWGTRPQLMRRLDQPFAGVGLTTQALPGELVIDDEFPYGTAAGTLPSTFNPTTLRRCSANGHHPARFSRVFSVAIRGPAGGTEPRATCRSRLRSPRFNLTKIIGPRDSTARLSRFDAMPRSLVGVTR